MAHTLDTHQVNDGLTGNPAATFNYTCGAGATALLLSLVVAGNTARAGGVPTYNGVALTQIDQLRTATETNLEMWVLFNPPTGSAYQISIPNTGGRTIHAHTCSAKAASGKASALDVASGNTGTTANPSIGVTTTVNGAFVYCRSGNGNLALGTGNKTQFGDSVWGTDHGAYVSMRMYELQASAGLTTFTETLAADDWCMIVVALKEINPPALLEGAATGAATAAGALTTEIRLAGAATCAATAAADLTAPQQSLLAGAATCSCSAAAALTTGIALAGAASCGVTGAGALTTEIRMAGVAACSGSAAAALTTEITLAGAASCSVTAEGTFSTEILLAGAAACSVSAAADLTTSPAILLAGAATCGITVAGALTTEIRMAGAADCAASAVAPLTTEITLAGEAALAATAAADLTAGPAGAALEGSAVCTLTAQAELLTQILLSGQASGAATASAALWEEGGPIEIFVGQLVERTTRRLAARRGSALMDETRRWRV